MKRTRKDEVLIRGLEEMRRKEKEKQLLLEQQRQQEEEEDNNDDDDDDDEKKHSHSSSQEDITIKKSTKPGANNKRRAPAHDDSDSDDSSNSTSSESSCDFRKKKKPQHRTDPPSTTTTTTTIKTKKDKLASSFNPPLNLSTPQAKVRLKKRLRETDKELAHLFNRRNQFITQLRKIEKEEAKKATKQNPDASKSKEVMWLDKYESLGREGGNVDDMRQVTLKEAFQVQAKASVAGVEVIDLCGDDDENENVDNDNVDGNNVDVNKESPSQETSYLYPTLHHMSQVTRTWTREASTARQQADRILMLEQDRDYRVQILELENARLKEERDEIETQKNQAIKHITGVEKLLRKKRRKEEEGGGGRRRKRKRCGLRRKTP
ncbi:hypothetical protein TL16_g08685 [Triparma laevis f. inornata]|uniref:Uncharacterized protein n=1 Tax=Triparma laevis f. inornata TaxID=1714386 RepID=A0A9W7EJB6_9STRA|nr:hypothetical protein TL16_g08685 [Triparma laevis f. inornata]